MKLDLLTLQENIFNYIKDNFKTETELDFVWDFLDLDTYKKSNTCFIMFPNITFNNLTRSCNEEKFTLEIYFVCRNGKSKELKKKVITMANDFYNFFYDENNIRLNGLVDTGEITTLDIFEAVEGNPNLKIAKLNIDLKIEI